MSENKNTPLNYIELPSIKEQKQVLILLHGYGSNNKDLIELGKIMQSSLPNVTFVAPNAPTCCENDLLTTEISLCDTYQWFPLTMTGNSGVKINNIEDVYQASQVLDQFILYVQEKYNVLSENIILFGFSQGAIISLYNSLYKQEKTYKAVIAHSGAFFTYEPFIQVNKNQNILLIHGEIDFIVPFSLTNNTISFLKKYDVKFETFFKPDLGHYVDEDTIKKSIDFVKKS